MMMSVADDVAHLSFEQDSKMGVKGAPLWPFIPLHHYLQPFLYILIGIWNDFLDKFREIVSDLIEYILQEEADLGSRKESLINKLNDLRKARDAWKGTEAGKDLQQVKAKRTRLHKALKDLQSLNDITGIEAGPAASAAHSLILDLDRFINEDVPIADEYSKAALDDDADDQDEDNNPEEPAETANEDVQASISDVKEKLRQVDQDITAKEKVFKAFSSAVTRANSMLTKTRDDIVLSKSTRRRSRDGIE